MTLRPTDLQLPSRNAKPRETGVTMIIDTGMGTNYFNDVIGSNADYVDFVKFGWGTSVVSNNINQKI